MESLISHLFKNPTNLSLLVITSFIIFGLILIFTAIYLIEEEKKNKDKTIKFSIKSTLFFTGLLIYILSPIGLVWYKVNQYKQITTNKEYTLTKKGKILTISSENQFLPSTDLEIIHEDDARIQVKFDDKFYTIDKQSEEIKEK